MNTTLIVMRHGNTFNAGDTILRVGSATDLPLTETGRQQGFLAGELLKQRNLIPAAVFCAPLKRTRQSAAEALRALGSDLAPQIADFLTELDYGSDDGKPEDDVVRALGRASQKDLSDEEAFAAGKEILARWDKEAILPAGWSHLQSRVENLGKEWCAFGKKVLSEYAGKVVLAVTSNGIARFSRALLPGAPLPEKGLKLSTGALGIYVYNGQSWQCGEWNLRPGR